MNKLKILTKAILMIKNWPTYLFEYFGLINKPILNYKLRNGNIFAIRPGKNDRVIFNQIWLSGVYELSGFEIEHSDVIVDIGAHAGFFSVLAAIKAKNGKVYSFEPAPENFAMLKKNLSLNAISNIGIFNKAVGEKGGNRRFVIYAESSGAHSFAYSQNGKSDIIDVPTVSLDDFVVENKIARIDFLKMDCEGAEYEILFNVPAKTLGIINKIAMEYHDIDKERNALALKEILEKNGFKVTIRAKGDNMLYAKR